MKLLVKRENSGADFTHGRLFVDGVFECFTLEDRDRRLEAASCAAKVFGQTAIPRGIYRLIVNVSARFKIRLPLLLGVTCFEGIRIHPGNTKEDTEGCILVGATRGADRVLNSRAAFNRLMVKLEAAIAKGEQIEIEVA